MRCGSLMARGRSTRTRAGSRLATPQSGRRAHPPTRLRLRARRVRSPTQVIHDRTAVGQSHESKPDHRVFPRPPDDKPLNSGPRQWRSRRRRFPRRESSRSRSNTAPRSYIGDAFLRALRTGLGSAWKRLLNGFCPSARRARIVHDYQAKRRHARVGSEATTAEGRGVLLIGRRRYYFSRRGSSFGLAALL